MATKGFHQVGLHQAKHVVCLHDGLDEFGATFHSWFPGAIHQTDRYHVNMRIWQIAQGERSIIEFIYNEPGLYMFHAHVSEFAELGWSGMFEVV